LKSVRLFFILQAEYERRANPNDKGQQALLEEMRAHVKKVFRPS